MVVIDRIAAAAHSHSDRIDPLYSPDGVNVHPIGSLSQANPGLYLSNFIRGGSKFWLLKSTTVLMHRYIESRPPCVFLIAAGGSEIFAGGSTSPPPDKYSPGQT